MEKSDSETVESTIEYEDKLTSIEAAYVKFMESNIVSVHSLHLAELKMQNKLFEEKIGLLETTIANNKTYISLFHEKIGLLETTMASNKTYMSLMERMIVLLFKGDIGEEQREELRKQFLH